MEKVFTNFIIEEKEREHFYDHIHYMVTERLRVALLLLGPPGSGKTTICEKLLAGMLGFKSMQKISNSALDTHFNSQMAYNRLVVLDEVTLHDDERIDYIKAYLNDRIPVIFKGKDGRTLDNYASYVLCGNRDNKYALKPEDRRFSVPMTSRKKFDVMMDKEELEFINMKNPHLNPKYMQMMAEAFYFFVQRVPKTKSDQPIKGDYFFQVVDKALPAWQFAVLSWVKENCIKEQPVMAKQLLSEYNSDKVQGKVQLKTLVGFIESYTHRDECHIGSFVTVSPADKDKLDIPPKYRKETVAFMPDTEFLRVFGKYGDKSAEEVAQEAMDQVEKEMGEGETGRVSKPKRRTESIDEDAIAMAISGGNVAETEQIVEDLL